MARFEYCGTAQPQYGIVSQCNLHNGFFSQSRISYIREKNKKREQEEAALFGEKLTVKGIEEGVLSKVLAKLTLLSPTCHGPTEYILKNLDRLVYVVLTLHHG